MLLDYTVGGIIRFKFCWIRLYHCLFLRQKKSLGFQPKVKHEEIQVEIHRYIHSKHKEGCRLIHKLSFFPQRDIPLGLYRKISLEWA